MVVSGEGSGIATVQGQTEFAATASPRPAPRGRDRESSAARSNFIEHHVPSDVKRVRMEARSQHPSSWKFLAPPLTMTSLLMEGVDGSPRLAGKDACPTVGVPMDIPRLPPARCLDSPARACKSSG